MISARKEIVQALKGRSVDGYVRISDKYPKDWAKLPTILLTEENNAVNEQTSDDLEASTLVEYRIDIWSKDGDTLVVEDVDEAMKSCGLRRTFCNDVPDPSGLKHKLMRFEGILSPHKNGEVYVFERG